ncbi:MAG: beta-mannosidase, partial [Sphingobacteriales bacterium]
SCTPAELKALWRFTSTYLRDEKELHNLLWVYNTNGFASEAEFFERYPGDDMVDVLSFDLYHFEGQNRQAFIDTVRYELDLLVKMAAKKNKLAAFAETGLEAVPDSEWWTKTLQPALAGYPISYVLVWRNAGFMPSMNKMHYYGPYKGHASEQNFLKFTRSGNILLEKGLKERNIYK